MRERQISGNVVSNRCAVVGETGRGAASRFLVVKLRFGRGLWRFLHATADGWPCTECRPRTSAWMEGLHDSVNSRLGRRPFRPESFERYASGSLNGRYHATCFGCRLVRLGAWLMAREWDRAEGSLTAAE